MLSIFSISPIVIALPGWPGTVVEEVVLGQHLEHVVPSTLEEGRPHPLHLAGVDVGELADDLPDPDHLVPPLVLGHVSPVGLVVTVTDGVGGDLVSEVPVLVDQAVVGGGLGHEVRGPDVAAVGVLVVAIEELTVVVLLGQGGEPVVEGEVDDLGPGVQVGDDGLLTAAVAVGRLAGRGVTSREENVTTLLTELDLLSGWGALLCYGGGEEREEEEWQCPLHDAR